MAARAPRTDPWVDQISASQDRVTQLFTTPFTDLTEASRVTDLEVPHLDGCQAIFLYSDNRGAPRRKLARVGGYRCPCCRFDSVTALGEHLDEVAGRVLWTARLTAAGRRNTVQWRRRNDIDVDYVAIARDHDDPILWASSRQIPEPCRVRLTRVVIAELQEDLWSGSPVRHTAWSDGWRPRKDRERPSEAKGVGAGFQRPDLADKTIRAAGYEPDIASGHDAPVVAAELRAQISVINDGYGPNADRWGRSTDPEEDV